MALRLLYVIAIQVFGWLVPLGRGQASKASRWRLPRPCSTRSASDARTTVAVTVTLGSGPWARASSVRTDDRGPAVQRDRYDRWGLAYEASVW